jgi:hypothetical protein
MKAQSQLHYLAYFKHRNSARHAAVVLHYSISFALLNKPLQEAIWLLWERNIGQRFFFNLNLLLPPEVIN